MLFWHSKWLSKQTGTNCRSSGVILADIHCTWGPQLIRRSWWHAKHRWNLTPRHSLSLSLCHIMRKEIPSNGFLEEEENQARTWVMCWLISPSPRLCPWFRPMKIDHTSGLTLYQGYYLCIIRQYFPDKNWPKVTLSISDTIRYTVDIA